jgi:hypothetical protein
MPFAFNAHISQTGRSTISCRQTRSIRSSSSVRGHFTGHLAPSPRSIVLSTQRFWQPCQRCPRRGRRTGCYQDQVLPCVANVSPFPHLNSPMARIYARSQPDRNEALNRSIQLTRSEFHRRISSSSNGARRCFRVSAARASSGLTGSER